MVKEKINLGLENFNHTIDGWISELQSYNLGKLLMKPTPESWSLGQLYNHLIDQTKYYFEQIEDCLNQNENSTENMKENAKFMFSKNSFPDERIKGDPAFTEKVQQPASLPELLEKMKQLKLEINRIGNKILENSSTGKTRHPGLGYFNAREWFQFAEMHLRHHWKQKERIDDFLKGH